MRAPISRRVGLWLGFCPFVLSLAISSSAAAQPKPKTPARIDVASITTKLKSGNEGQLRQGLDDLRNAGPAAASPAVVLVVADMLARGLSETISQQAIETLGDLESPDGSAVLVRYATHRTVALRRAAVKALARTKGPNASAPLRHALSDPDAHVRATAASGLGALKAKDAVPDLFVALDHKVNEAAASIGQLCTPEQCEQLAGKLGKLPFDVVASGLDQILFRPTADVSDDEKIKVLGHLREMGTLDANKFLKDTQTRLPKQTSARIKQALEQAVKATAGGPQ